VCRDLINSFSFLSEVNVKSRVVVYDGYGAAFWHVTTFRRL